MTDASVDASVRPPNKPSTLYMTLIFDLLTPKVDCFMPFPRGPLVLICIKVISLICLQNIVFPSLVTDEQTNGQLENNASVPCSQSGLAVALYAVLLPHTKFR